MTLSSIKRFLPAPPPRRVLLLADDRFFVRAVAVTEGASAADVAAQAELAVESLAPFPLSQLYYGHHWVAGADHALVYAAYRKRFTAEETESWADAEIVVPSFVALLGGEPPKAATAWVFPGEMALTGVYFADGSGVPSAVRTEALASEATGEERAAARERLLAAFPEKREIVDFETAPGLSPAAAHGEFAFRAGSRETRITAAEAGPLDVRDKDELAARRRAAARDVLLWRTFVGALAAIGVAALLELAMVGGAIWQKQRLALQARQAPVVEGIMTSQSLATRIDELSTKRLRPFEMLALVNTVRPRSILFVRTSTGGLNKLEVDAKTGASGDIDLFRSSLNKLPGCERAEVLDPRTRDGQSTFRLVVTFRSDAFAAKEPEAAPAPEAAQPKPEEAGT